MSNTKPPKNVIFIYTTKLTRIQDISIHQFVHFYSSFVIHFNECILFIHLIVSTVCLSSYLFSFETFFWAKKNISPMFCAVMAVRQKRLLCHSGCHIVCHCFRIHTHIHTLSHSHTLSQTHSHTLALTRNLHSPILVFRLSPVLAKNKIQGENSQDIKSIRQGFNLNFLLRNVLLVIYQFNIIKPLFFQIILFRFFYSLLMFFNQFYLYNYFVVIVFLIYFQISLSNEVIFKFEYRVENPCFVNKSCYNFWKLYLRSRSWFFVQNAKDKEE